MSVAERAPAVPEVTESALPGALAEVAQVIGGEAGIQAALAIAKRLGGRKMRIPPAPKASHPLNHVVGAKAAAVIIAHFAGETVVWPSAKPYLRWREARRLRLEERLPTPAIAAQLGISESQVRRLLQGLDADPVAPACEAAAPATTCPCCGRRLSRPRPRAAGPDTRQLCLFDAEATTQIC